MKVLVTILFLFSGIQAFAVPAFEKLAVLNKCWLEQKDIDPSVLTADMDLTDQNWIRLHLTQVERTLRNRSTEGLTEVQKQNRLSALDHLHGYMLAGAFPQNEDYTYRTPIFIDKHDNFCAVGYLVKATGYEHVSRMIAAKTNLAYVREMNYPELFAWAGEYGFTIDELAWIQPTYGPPPGVAHVMAQGTDGPVRELFVGTGDKLYVGGSFANVAGNVSANNIAYLTEANNIDTWHTMGTGVNGTVHAIAEYNGNIFVGGSFTTAGGAAADNIAYWDGTTWHNAGCLNGTVKDLVVFNGTLYASGNFSLCSSSAPANFASWNGTSWQAVAGLVGTINTMEVAGSNLYLGGNFTFAGNPANIIQWSTVSGFQSLGNSMVNEVMDIIVYHNTVYASCKQTTTNPELAFKLQSNTWTPFIPTVNFSSIGIKSFSTLCDYNDSLVQGGDFSLVPMMGHSIHNNMNLTMGGTYQNFYLNGPVNKMITYKGSLISGGDFTGHIVRKFAAGALCAPPPVGAYNITDTSADISWFVWGPYNYEYAITFSATPPSSGNTTSSSYQHLSNLVPATTYYIHVRRNCVAPPYITAWATDSFTTLPTPPPPVPCTEPDTVKITNITAHSADVAWVKNGLPAMAMYQHDITTSSIPPVIAPVTAAMGYQALSLQPATQYYLHLRTICSAGDTSQWSTTAFVTGEATGISSTAGAMLSVYPNPVKDKLTINLHAHANGQLILSDITGKELIREKVKEENMHLDVAHLQPGIYLLQYSNSTGTQTLRVVKE